MKLPRLPRLPRKPKTHLKLTLVENGIDFVRSGIEQYFLRDTPKPRDHKYAVLHVFAGVLLLMKARLAREHASLIFVKVEESGRPDAITVNFTSAEGHRGNRPWAAYGDAPVGAEDAQQP